LSPKADSYTARVALSGPKIIGFLNDLTDEKMPFYLAQMNREFGLYFVILRG
jgi:hypothetical protein